MTKYSELVKALRNCSGQGFLTCRECQYNNNMLSCAYKMMRDAAAAIEELDAEETRLLLITSELQDKVVELQAEVERLQVDVEAAYALMEVQDESTGSV